MRTSVSSSTGFFDTSIHLFSIVFSLPIILFITFPRKVVRDMTWWQTDFISQPQLWLDITRQDARRFFSGIIPFSSCWKKSTIASM